MVAALRGGLALGMADAWDLEVVNATLAGLEKTVLSVKLISMIRFAALIARQPRLVPVTDDALELDFVIVTILLQV